MEQTNQIICPLGDKLFEIIGHPSFLYLGDSKASTYLNLAKIHAEGGIYCFPLVMSQPRPKLLLDWVKNPVTQIIKFGQQDGEESERKDSKGEGFEVSLGSIWVEPKTKTEYKWMERWLVVKSYPLATRQIKGLHTRLQKGESALATLAIRPGNDQQVLQRKVEEILKNNRISKYIEYSITKKISYDKVYIGYGSRSQSSSYKRVRKTTLQLSYWTLDKGKTISVDITLMKRVGYLNKTLGCIVKIYLLR